MTSISRRLSLHASALSDDEYQFYTTSLLSIISVEEEDGGISKSHTMDDAYYENMSINLRETRAWLRGRYSHLPSLIIDKILKLFSPSLSATDSLSGGEFFAVLRLVVHAEHGKEVDRSLAFVQAQVGWPSNPGPPRREQTLASSASSVAESFSHNPFTLTSHPQPPLHPSQRSDSSSTHSAHNPFVHRSLPSRSDDGNVKLPPLPPRKQITPQSPSMAVAPSKHHNRSRSPSKLVINPPIPLSPLPPTIPPKPSHHITSTLIKQSLQATKAAQTMKKAEEQLERERVMQVLKSSSTVSGAYSLAGASVTNSSVVVGTHVYNQHQYQHQQRRSPSPMMQLGQGQGQGGNRWNRKIGYAASSTSSGSDERAPPLPKRRMQQQQPSPPLSASSLEQVALATTRPHPTGPPSSAASAFSNPEASNNAHNHAYRNTTSRTRVPVDSTIAVPYTSSPEQSPKRTSFDLPSSDTTRGRPPPTHPDRKPHHFQYQSNQNSHARSPYSDPFAGTNLESKDPDEQTMNVNQSFESIYGSPGVISTNPFPHSSPPTTTGVTQSTPNPNRIFRSKSLHQTNPPVPPAPRSLLGRKRPESIQVSRVSDIGVEVDQNESSSSPDQNDNSGHVSRHKSLMASGNNRRSSLSVSSTPSSSSLNHLSSWPPPTPHRQNSSSSSLTVARPPLHSHSYSQPPSSASSTTMKHDILPIQAPNPLTSLQKTFLQIQPHLDKARYKAEAGLSKRGFVRDGLMTRGTKSCSGSGVGADRDGEDEDGLEDGLEGLMSSSGEGKNQIGKSRWGVHQDGGGPDPGYDGEVVDQDSDWTRNEGMSSMSRPPIQGRVRRQYSDEGGVLTFEKDNLKWPAGEGWKPL